MISLLPKIFPRSQADRQADIERSLMRQEAQIGGKLFGPVPEGHSRQFFCLDEHTWIWHEEWIDSKGQRQVVTTRYSVLPNGVVKSQNGHPAQRITRHEARNLYKAAELYYGKVGAYYQQMLNA